MPPKAPKKRSRSPSVEVISSSSSSSSGQTPKRSRSRSRSKTPLAAVLQAESEWLELQERSILALPPTAAVLVPLLRRHRGAGTAPIVLPVAAFDMDDTLLVYRRGKAATTASEDGPLEWAHPSVLAHLRALAASGYILAVFSNQSTINGFKGGWNEAKAAAVRRKIIALGRAVEAPLVAYVSTGTDRWRKPLPGMWGVLQDQLDAAAKAPVDCNSRSIYVGDAAGRPVGPGRAKKDFSCADRRFAHNLGLPFYTQTQFFDRFPASAALCDGNGLSKDFLDSVAKHAAEPFDWGGLGPDVLRAIPSSYAGLAVTRLTAAGAAAVTLPTLAPFFQPGGSSSPAPQEMVILVAPPSSGKSTFFRRHLAPLGHAHVNRDTLGTKEKCLEAAEEHWRAGRSVVVDNTNSTKADRALYIDLVRKLVGPVPGARGKAGAAARLPVRVITLDHARALAQHLGGLRVRLGQSARLPDVAYHSFFARYEPVTLEEVRATGIAEALVLPPAISFEGMPPQAKREFALLS